MPQFVQEQRSMRRHVRREKNPATQRDRGNGCTPECPSANARRQPTPTQAQARELGMPGEDLPRKALRLADQCGAEAGNDTHRSP
jgi:hypothetical protein